MPLPTPRKGETQDEFISRFMSNGEAKREFPDQKQRLAVAFSTWRRSKKSVNPLKTFHFKCVPTRCWEDEVAINKSLGDETKTPERFMEVIVSGLKEDRDGDRMSQKAIDGMAKQFDSGTIPFFPDHGRDEQTGEPFVYSWKQMMGVWVGGRQEGDHLLATVRLNRFHPDQELFWNYTKNAKMPIGFSIGGKTSEPKEVYLEDEKDEKENN